MNEYLIIKDNLMSQENRETVAYLLKKKDDKGEYKELVVGYETIDRLLMNAVFEKEVKKMLDGDSVKNEIEHRNLNDEEKGKLSKKLQEIEQKKQEGALTR